MEKKNNWLNILKKLLIATGIVVIISVIATIGIGNYFVNYAILRTGNGGDREVKNKEVVEVASIDNETERIIEENREEEKQLANQWSNTIKNEKVEITVEDTGIGISQEDQEFIFKRFSQVEGNGATKATSSGIGLTLVKDIVDLHGGYIRLESELNKGSKFTIGLPDISEDAICNN